jgi:hypothetical protein
VGPAVNLVSHPSELSAITRRGLVLAWFTVATALTAAASRVRRTQSVTFPIAVGTIGDQHPRPKWSTIAVPGATLVSDGFPQPLWTVRTALHGEPERRPHPVGFAVNWILYAVLAWAALRILWRLRLSRG